MPQHSITASMLYNLVSCEHRLYLDMFGDASQCDEPNAFIQLLWEKGTLFEQEVIQKLETPFLDLSRYRGDEKEGRTREAIEQGVSLIYSGRLSVDNLLGEPDLLRQESTGYVAGDIKSGSGDEGDGDQVKPKKTYAVQLGLYTDILERLDVSAGRGRLFGIFTAKKSVMNFQNPKAAEPPRLGGNFTTHSGYVPRRFLSVPTLHSQPIVVGSANSANGIAPAYLTFNGRKILPFYQNWVVPSVTCCALTFQPFNLLRSLISTD